jgi:hypothetical protein
MNMKSVRIFGVVLASFFLLQSCKKDDAPVDESTIYQVTVSDLAADTIVYLDGQPVLSNGQPAGAGKFTFYSLEDNAIISSADTTTLDWDLGFRGTTIITNGGTSGPGGGGAFVYTGTFTDLTAVPADSIFKVDNSPTMAITTGSNKGWYVYNGQQNLITPIPGRVLVIRTASGKYAIVEILNYYKGGVTPDPSAPDNDKISKQRYYKFRYTYQDDGSKKLVDDTVL